MTLQEFSHAYPGEGDHVEFKRGFGTRRLQEPVVAFSNADGGVILLGVEPDGNVVGVEQPGELARSVYQAISEIVNPGQHEVHQLGVGGKVVLAVAVDRRREGFAQMPDGSVRIRRGASNPALLGRDLIDLLATRTFERFESTVTAFSFDDVGEALEEVAAALGIDRGHDLETRLLERGLLAEDRGRRMLTVAGALLLMDDPTQIGCRAYVDIRRYDGVHREPDKVWNVGGPVSRQVSGVTEEVLAELGTVSAVLGTRRVDMPKLPPRVVREAVANAVAHRSYQSNNTATVIEIRPDRVSIRSPGSLPEPVTIPNIRHQQAARNPVVIDILRRLHLAEDQGLGIDRMEDDMEAELLEAPRFADDGSSFTVTLFLRGPVTPAERAWIRQLVVDERIDGRSGAIVVHAARAGSITNGDVRELLNLDSVEARALLQRLVASGVFQRRGERGGAQYVIAPNLSVPTRVRFSDEELDVEVLEMAQARGRVTNADVRAATGLDRSGALDVLARLVEAGHLERRGERRGAHYVPIEPSGAG